MWRHVYNFYIKAVGINELECCILLHRNMHIYETGATHNNTVLTKQVV